jgi:hypothetical protein
MVYCLLLAVNYDSFGLAIDESIGLSKLSVSLEAASWGLSRSCQVGSLSPTLES